jgi:hypothetical protein
MTITDIENKTFAELKAERDALVAEAAGLPIDVVARHYIRARMDATQRDEKLAEQGTTIVALQEGLAATKQQAEAAVADVTKRMEASKLEANERIAAIQGELARCATARDAADDQVIGLQTDTASLSRKLQQETERAGRLKDLSNISRAAVVQAAATLNEAVNQMTVEAADQGK